MRMRWDGARRVVVLAAMVVGCGGAEGWQLGEPIDVDGDGESDGRGLDGDGDGQVDAVDVDGDGDADGQDVNGDGVITIWTDLETGELAPSAAQLASMIVAVDPDLFDDLDPRFPRDGLGPDGTISVPAWVTYHEATFPALTQGSLGSCAAFASMSTAALLNRRFRPVPSYDLPSPAFLYARQLEARMAACEAGTYLHHGLDTLVREGAPSTAEVPYDGATCTPDPANPDGSEFRIGGWAVLHPFSRDHARKALATGLVLPFGVTLPSNFQDFYLPAAYAPFRSASAPLGGPHGSGHAMVIVGYDDWRHAYRVLNSWGRDWGDNGYFWWDYDDLESREGLQVLVPMPMPEPEQLRPPAPRGLRVEVKGVVLGADGVLAIRIRTTEPVHLHRIVFGGIPDEVDQWIAYGDLAFRFDDTPPGDYLLTLHGTLRDGSPVDWTGRVTVE